MADFSRAVEYVIAQEGGFSNDRNDSGGATRYGISTPTLREYKRLTQMLPDVLTPGQLTRGEAIAIYREMFWRFDGVTSQMIATKVFDLCVNMGPTAGTMIAQRAAQRFGVTIKVDGSFGPRTTAALNAISARGQRLALFKAIVYHAADRYVSIVAANPSQLDFIDGWLARCARRPQD